MSEDLNRRAFVAVGFRWMPGMLLRGYNEKVAPRHRQARLVDGNEDDVGEGWLPDTEDPATIGCLLALAREKHGHHTYTKNHGVLGWIVCNEFWGDPWRHIACDSEAEAIVMLLETPNVQSPHNARENKNKP